MKPAQHSGERIGLPVSVHMIWEGIVAPGWLFFQSISAAGNISQRRSLDLAQKFQGFQN